MNPPSPLLPLFSSALMMLSACVVVGACGSSVDTSVSPAPPEGSDGSSDPPSDHRDGGAPSDHRDGGGPTPPPVVGASGTQCGTDFCWQAPVPSGNTLGAVWASSETDVWWVGRRGTVLHSNGAKTVAVSVPTTEDLFSVAGTSPSDVWVGGDNGVLLHFDGVAWTTVDTSSIKDGSLRLTLVGLVATKPNELFIRTLSNVIHKTASGFTTVYDDQTSAIGRSPDGTVWISAAYAFRRWNGSSFVAVPSVTNSYAYQMTFSSKDAGWAAMSSGIGRWNGTSWTKVVISGAGAFEPVTIAGATDDDVWALGHGGLYHLLGTTWSKVELPASQEVDTLDGRYRSLSLLALAKNDVWLGSGGGVSFHWDGAKWTSLNAIGRSDLDVVVALSATDVWAGSAGSSAHFDGTSWKAAAVPGSWLSGVTVGPKTAYSIDTSHKLRRYDGAMWTTVPESTGDRVWGSAPDDVWVISTSSNAARHYDGTNWTDVILPTKSEIIWGTSKTNVWVTGEDPALQFSRGAWRFDGASWTKYPVPVPGSTIVGFGGSGPTDMFAIDSNLHAAYRFTGTRFALKTPSFVTGPSSLHAMWSRSPTETWAVGSGGSVARWDGTKWEAKDAASANDLFAVTGTATDGPWLVGSFGAVLVKR